MVRGGRRMNERYNPVNKEPLEWGIEVYLHHPVGYGRVKYTHNWKRDKQHDLRRRGYKNL